ncbi:VOC family protein [Pelagicoccus enzymogenes]|uniref:VOC family protein n=1 Tax=Pelagicoccus enzymogenes TaxID=2773457 RepID=UPI00280C5923|nr:VOC family protein [Pelagicoccus enzymogenes]MDQ8200514.1 VOC family protein [Pelagicoccus enzymogenes]
MAYKRGTALEALLLASLLTLRLQASDPSLDQSTSCRAGDGLALQVGLDHISTVIEDLDLAADTFLDLGFAIKPGRSDENGLHNAHIKFEDGWGIELIKPQAGASDALSVYSSSTGCESPSLRSPRYSAFLAAASRHRHRRGKFDLAEPGTNESSGSSELVGSAPKKRDHFQIR